MDHSMSHVEQLLKGLEFFGNWSNYILVTTVAALGWVASTARAPISPRALRWVIGCLCASIVFAVFTLAMIPLVAENITAETKSFYELSPKFDLIYTIGPEVSLKLKWVCWPQHILFLVGIAIYSFASIRALKR